MSDPYKVTEQAISELRNRCSDKLKQLFPEKDSFMLINECYRADDIYSKSAPLIKITYSG